MAIHESPFFFRVCFGCDVLNGHGGFEKTITKEGDTVEVTLRSGEKGILRSDGPKRGFTVVEPFRAYPGFKRIHGAGESLPLAHGWRAMAT